LNAVASPPATLPLPLTRRNHPRLLEHAGAAWHVSGGRGAARADGGRCGYELVYQFSTAELRARSERDEAASSGALAGAAALAAAAVGGGGGGRAGGEGGSSWDGGGIGGQAQPATWSGPLPERIWQVALPRGGALGGIAPDKVVSVKTYEHPAHTGAAQSLLPCWGRAAGRGRPNTAPGSAR
jgi:hypothetical protein